MPARTLICLFLLSPWGLAGDPAPVDPKALAVVQRHLRVRGGVDRLRSVTSLRLSGQQLLLPVEVGIPWRREELRPNRFREEITVQGMVEVHTFDGTAGWVLIPWSRERQAQPMPQEQVEVLKEMDFEDPWLLAMDQRADLRYLGPSAFNRIPVVGVARKLGPQDELVGWFDQEVGLEVARERIHRELGSEYKVRTEFQEWHTVKDIAFPFEIVHRAVGRGRRQKVILDRVDVNPMLPETRFGKP
ncbi:MAG TPA: hypothetical protein VJ623_02250 [Holophagaceae bacterium]|nr:hypothetical protein [Holophagaceae bacterium]